MTLDDIEPGMTLWTILYADDDDIPICALIRGTVKSVSPMDDYPGYTCDWRYGSRPMTWRLYDPEEVFDTPQAAIADHVSWVLKQLTTDLEEIVRGVYDTAEATDE